MLSVVGEQKPQVEFPCGLHLDEYPNDRILQAQTQKWFYELTCLIRDKHRLTQFNELTSTLNKLGYFEAPASHKYHLAKRGGLLVHHVGVTLVLIRMKRLLYPKITDESCVIVGLLHDVGKLGTPGRPYYDSRVDVSWKSGDPYAKQETGPLAPVYMGVAARSLAVVSSKIDLSTWEAQAILYHDGQYIDDNSGVKLKETPLTLLLHHADMWTAFQIEQTYPILDEPFTFVGHRGWSEVE